MRALKALDPRVIEVKYCSTFDSTTEGNIGPSLDAAMDEMGEEFTIALPALPINGRTTYMAYHFVGSQLLSDSSMRDHPLTPMRNSNLVSHLQSQTKRKVGLAAYPVSRARIEQARAEGVKIAIVDCISDRDLESACEAIAHLRLISGSSAPAMKLPAIWQREKWWNPSEAVLRRPGVVGSGYLVVAGSCSVATQGQNKWLESQGAETAVLDPLALLGGDCETSKISDALQRGRVCLLRIASAADDVERVQQWATARNLGANEAGVKIAYALAAAVLKIMERTPPLGLIVAGGETSGAVSRTLSLGALEVGRNIEPGVPLCRALGRFELPVVLKSGNFGSLDFYGRAIQAIKESSN